LNWYDASIDVSETHDRKTTIWVVMGETRVDFVAKIDLAMLTTANFRVPYVVVEHGPPHIHESLKAIGGDDLPWRVE
jgi:hypothetical protein